MASQNVNARGTYGEDCAAAYLLRGGWILLARNFRSGHREIDIIAENGGVIAFVEVKTRTLGGWCDPVCAVGLGKRRHIVAAAQGYLLAHPECGELQPRFDIAEVVLARGDPPRTWELRYLPGAFTLDDL